MLDDVTKKRINSLRQILVGKLPDPKAQVEQITNGLIYKFMNDMDEQSVSMGGKSTYFSGKFQKYSWKNLMNSKTSGVERLSLYSEALYGMSENENLPSLFRDIFKDSVLPFKDPKTLNMFLEEINEFHYSNSEKLGDAFEYLLSFMGSQGDAGQFRTPRHIIDFITEIVNPQKNETVLDPACGTAGFLISAYKHILKQNTKKNLGDGLNASDRKKIGENLNGYDISPDMVKMSLVNMYLHKFTNPKINEYDTLSSEDRWNEYYDVILANPPFFSPKGGIMPHNRFGVKSTKAEVLFTDYINEHLKPNGRAGVIVPEGIIFQTGTAYKQLRKKLIETSLVGVISLPSGVFNPYSGVKTSILILDKENSKKLEEVIFLNVKNDGYSLGAQRTQIEKNDLPNIIEEFKNFITKNKTTHKVSKLDLLNNENYSLNYSNYELENNLSNANYIKLNNEKYFQISSGGTPKSDKDKYWNGNINWITLADLPQKDFISLINNSKRKITELGLKNSSAKIIPNNSIIVSTRATLGRVAVNNVELATNQGFKNITIKDTDNISYKYVAYLMKSLEKKINNLATGGTFKELSKTAFGNLEIPLLPIENQIKIVEELDSYQKIIDGCRQVVENYKPSIDIDPSWEMVQLQEIADVISGQSPPSSSYNKTKKGLPFYQGKTDYGDIYLKDTDTYTSEVTKISKKNDIIMSVRAPVGPVNLNSFDEICIGRGLCAIRPKNTKDLEFIFNFLQTDGVVKGHMGSTYESINRDEILKIKIPNPNRENKNNIINQILEERKIIEGNKKIIEKFNQKVRDRINKIWSS
mgnify:CR=1 FL=1